MSDKSFPRWFACGTTPIIRRYDSDGNGTRIYSGGIERPTLNTLKDAEKLVARNLWREVSKDQAPEILKGRKGNE